MKPFVKASVPQHELDALRMALKLKPAEFFKDWGIGVPEPAELDKRIDEIVEQAARGAHWNNDKYQVVINDADIGEGFPPMWHLSIKRHDRYPVFNWRDLQAIKNQLVGHENEAVMLFPAESRLVDGANQYHIFCLQDSTLRFPFGFTERAVSNDSIGKSRNRPLDEDEEERRRDEYADESDKDYV